MAEFENGDVNLSQSTPVTEGADTSIASIDNADPGRTWQAVGTVPPSLAHLMAQAEATEEDLNTGTLDETGEEAAIEDDEAVQVDSGGEGDGEQSLTEADEYDPKNPKGIPPKRFNEVNEKNKALEARLEAVEQERAAERQKQQEHNAKLQRARSANFSDVESYEAADAWARSAGHGSIEDYQSSMRDREELEKYEQSVIAKHPLDEDAQKNLVEARKQLLEARRETQRAAANTQFVTRQMVDREIAAAETLLGVPLVPEFSDAFRDPQVTPDAVKWTATAIQKQLAPILAKKDQEIADLTAQLEHIAKGLPETIKTHADNAVAKAAANRTAQTRTPSPEGRGGMPPRPASAPTDWRQNVGERASLNTLIERGKRRTG